MFTKSDSDLLSEKLAEFKALLISYAKQEIQQPLTALLKWTLLGLLGSVFIFLGLLFISMGFLRLLQDKVVAFNGDLSFVPYCITALWLLTISGLLLRSARKHR